MNNTIKTYRDEIKNFNLLYTNYINNKIKEYGLDVSTIEPYNDTELDMYEKYMFNMLNDEENKLYNNNVEIDNVLKYLPENIKSKIYSKQINVFSIETLMYIIDLYFDIKFKESISKKSKYIDIRRLCNDTMFSVLLEGIIHTSFIDFYMNNKELVENSLK